MIEKNDELKKILKELIKYESEYSKKEKYHGKFEEIVNEQSKKSDGKSTIRLIGNKATLLRVGLRILLVADSNYDEGTYIDKYSGELEDDTIKLIVRKKIQLNKYKIKKY